MNLGAARLTRVVGAEDKAAGDPDDGPEDLWAEEGTEQTHRSRWGGQTSVDLVFASNKCRYFTFV